MNTGGKMPNVAIGIPSGENVPALFMTHMSNLLMRNKIPISIFINVVSSRISYNRNSIIELAKNADSTHLFFIDSDMTFPPDSLKILIDHDKDIVGATAAKREESGEAVGLTIEGKKLTASSSLVRMLYMGPCLMLIKMEVFDKLKQPYFCEPPQLDGGLWSEDAYFCNSLLEAGMDIWCDAGLSRKVGHRGGKTYCIKDDK